MMTSEYYTFSLQVKLVFNILNTSSCLHGINSEGGKDCRVVFSDI
jgi:hypothetical protein